MKFTFYNKVSRYKKIFVQKFGERFTNELDYEHNYIIPIILDYEHIYIPISAPISEIKNSSPSSKK